MVAPVEVEYELPAGTDLLNTTVPLTVATAVPESMNEAAAV
jgi:hypothetical protein